MSRHKELTVSANSCGLQLGSIVFAWQSNMNLHQFAMSHCHFFLPELKKVTNLRDGQYHSRMFSTHSANWEVYGLIFSTHRLATDSIGVTWGGGQGGTNSPPPQYFFKVGIVYVVTELNNVK
jgi:hypothetical protein